MDIVVAYDIATEGLADARRLRRVAKICEGYGFRRQKSVFECRISDVQFVRLSAELLGAIIPERDSVVIYKLGASVDSCRTVLGKPPAIDIAESWIF
jgi:CRISPR-associated protein Cas2